MGIMPGTRGPALTSANNEEPVPAPPVPVEVARGSPGDPSFRKPSRPVHFSHATGVPHQMKLTAVYQKVPEGYIAFVEELPGANAQGETLDEARDSLAEAVELVLGANRQLSELSLEGKDVIREPLIVN
jgi:predicted RNase H-like HicB family nuclease